MSHLPDMFRYFCRSNQRSIPRLQLITLPEVGVAPLQLVMSQCRGSNSNTSAWTVNYQGITLNNHNYIIEFSAYLYRECSTPDNPLYIRCDGNATQLNSHRGNTGRMKAVDGVKNLYKHVKPLKHSDVTSARTRNGGVVLSRAVKVFGFFCHWASLKI